jgi:hypothetical protein
MARAAVTMQIVLDLSMVALAVRLIASAARRAAHIEERTIEGTDGTTA